MANEIIKYEPEQTALIRRTLAKDLTDQEFELYLAFCQGMGLNPLKRQIYAMVYNKDKPTRTVVQITSIDGYRSIALRTGRYMGQTPQEWCGKDGKWVDIWLKAEPPYAARVGVYVKGNPNPTYAVARYHEYLPADERKRSMWIKFPDLMISKCAEALALRKAFPEDLGGLYVTEEIENVDGTNYSATIEKPPANQLPTVDLTKKQTRPYTPDYLQAKMQDWIEKSQLNDVITDTERTELEGYFEHFLDADIDGFKAFYEFLFNMPIGFIERRCYDALRQWIGVKYSNEGEITINKNANVEFQEVIRSLHDRH